MAASGPRRRRLLVAGGLVALLAAALLLLEPRYAYVPPPAAVLNPGSTATAQLRAGRKAFYGQSFGNEAFLTDVSGLLDGPLTLGNFARAVLRLGGRGTGNLQVAVARTVTVGGRTFEKGTVVDTGIDVPRGAWVPLGLPLRLSRRGLQVGIACAACHATVARDSGRVIEGAPNADFNAGVLVALASNSAAYFTHTGVADLTPFLTDASRQVPAAGGGEVTLPDPAALEAAVDATLLRWPPGAFDATSDLQANPTRIPHSFTRGNHPYGWSGFAAAGLQQGLEAFNNNAHADPLAVADLAPALFGLDREQYLGTLLQNAARRRYRFVPASGRRPSAFFGRVDPTPGAPGVSQMLRPPTWPRITLMAPDGLFLASPGTRVGQQAAALAAWQNTLAPPALPAAAGAATLARGRAAFARAGCLACHAGAAGTSNRVVPAPEVGTDPTRATALRATERLFAPPATYAEGTPVPVPPGALTEAVPTAHLDPAQLRLGWAHGGSPGGYKIPGLTGLAWRAPYLHDGGVAVGGDRQGQVGVAATLGRGIAPDPAESLRALLDRELRGRVIAANRAAGLPAVHVTGEGHRYWADAAAGFSRAEQAALIAYLLAFGQT